MSHTWLVSCVSGLWTRLVSKPSRIKKAPIYDHLFTTKIRLFSRISLVCHTLIQFRILPVKAQKNRITRCFYWFFCCFVVPSRPHGFSKIMDYSLKAHKLFIALCVIDFSHTQRWCSDARKKVMFVQKRLLLLPFSC